MKGSALSFGAALALGSLMGLSSAQKNHRDVCPATCSDVGSASSNWNVYPSVSRLSWCNQTMLVSFNIYNDIDNPGTHVRLATCASDADASLISSRVAAQAMTDASKPVVREVSAKSKHKSTVPATSTVQSASSTSISLQNSTAVVEVQILSSGTSGGPLASDLVLAASALQAQVGSGSNSQETILFAYSNGAVVGVYSGLKMESTSTHDLLQQLAQTVHGSTADIAIMQVCGHGRNADYVMGVIAVADSTGHKGLGMAQDALAAWDNATCVTLDNSSKSSINMTVHQLAQTPVIKPRSTPRELALRDTCLTATVVSGDSCSSLATTCGITAAEFTDFNPSSTLCSTLAVGELVCCSSGTLPASSPVPQPNPDGTCSTIAVVSGDSCSSLATTCGITAAEFTDFNPSSTLCSTLAVGELVCCSSGTLPASSPVPQPNPDGTCSVTQVVGGDSCSSLATTCGITPAEFTDFNPSSTLCSDLTAGEFVCCSSGTLPDFAPQPDANGTCFT
jgi:chitinase